MLNRSEYSADRNSKRIVNLKQPNDNINSDISILEKIDDVKLTINGYEHIKGGDLLNPYIPNSIVLKHFNLKIILEKKHKYDTQIENKLNGLQDTNQVDVNSSCSGLTIKKDDIVLNVKNPSETFKKIEKEYSTNTLRNIIDDNSTKSLIKMVNSNAYELREMILKNAIDVVLKYSKSDNLDSVINDIMKTSEKFYDFVESKRKC